MTPPRSTVASAGRPVLVSIAGDELSLSLDDVQVGSGAETLELVNATNAEVTFGVNLTYLSDAVAAHPSTEVEIGWTAPDKAVFISSREDDMPVTIVVMPVRM